MRRNSSLQTIILCVTTLWFNLGFATEDTYPLATVQQQQQFTAILHELRCLVCQNESLAESNAPLAQDLRQQVYEMVQAGKSDAYIKDYLVDRYGAFVLFKPEFSPKTYVLWLSPFVMLLLGFLIIYLTFRRNIR